MLERTRTGLQELPSNAGWLVSQMLKPAEAIGSAAGSAAASTRDRGGGSGQPSSMPPPLEETRSNFA